MISEHFICIFQKGSSRRHNSEANATKIGKCYFFVNNSMLGLHSTHFFQRRVTSFLLNQPFFIIDIMRKLNFFFLDFAHWRWHFFGRFKHGNTRNV